MQTSSYVDVAVVVRMLQNVEACRPGHSSDLQEPRLTVKISRVNCKTSLTGSLARGPSPSTTTRQRRPNNNNKMSNNTDMTTTWVYNVLSTTRNHSRLVPRCRGLFRGIASPAVLYHKDPARASKDPH